MCHDILTWIGQESAFIISGRGTLILYRIIPGKRNTTESLQLDVGMDADRQSFEGKILRIWGERVNKFLVNVCALPNSC